jgi:WD40 repeat protein
MGDIDLRFLLDPTTLATIVALLAFAYTILIGSRTIPEWLAEQRKRSDEKAKQKSHPSPDAPHPPSQVTHSAFTGTVLYREDHRLTTVACSPDGEYVAFGGFSQRVYVLSLATSQVEIGESHTGIIRSVHFRSSGDAVVSAADDGLVKVTSFRHKELMIPGRHDGPVYSAAFHPSEELIASAGKDGVIRLWDLARAPIFRPGSDASKVITNAPVTVMRNAKGAVFAIAFDKTGKTLASGGVDGSVALWDLPTGSPRYLTGFAHTVFSVCFHPDGEHVAAGASDGTIRLWNLKANSCRLLVGHLDTARWLAFAPAGDLLVSASKDRTLRVWELASERSWVLDGHQDYVYGVAFRPSGDRILSVAGDGTLRLWPVPPFNQR